MIWILVIHNVIMQSAQVKQAIKKSAQQMASEPLELLKNAARQISPEELGYKDKNDESEQVNSANVSQEENYKKQVAEQDGRHLQALESELKDIRRQKLFNELMKRIQEGEDVSLEEFTELSYEQRDVLKAQIQAVKTRNSQPVTTQLPELSLKHGRKMGGGQKGAAKKEQTRVEKPVPPSG